MFNVTSYCDWYFVHTITWESLDGKQRGWISFSNKHNLRHFLALLMRSVTSLKEYVDEEDVDKMSNESMKMFMAKFLYEKF
ncbi:hypothetical protein CAEBREN_08144 [Caenorhabditis brenneri]|uniref:Uncharacterized protein n=1 Tax=Caenorhabditis brenneri TaxID=135651 RepID=G0NIU9_CAEBE|nr:hypothetical protein CAEBREN_08144 [Caenorhabditis brenneri]